MKYEVFERILNDLEEMDKRSQRLYDVGMDIINITEPYSQAIYHLFGAYYGISGKDWIEWFIYEKAGREDMKAYDKKGKEICRNRKELWKLIEKEKADDYVLPKKMSEEERDSILKSLAEGFGK